MGRKRNRHKNKGANDPAFDPANPNKTSNWGGLGTAAPTPLVACQPSADGVGGALVAIAYGSSFSVHDASADDALVPLTHAKDNIAEGAEATGPCADGRWHAETIRVLRFDPTGRFLVTGGDDKILRLWRVVEKKRELSNDDNGGDASVTTSSTVTMECYKKTKKQPKKLCGGDFTDDGEYVTFANKYGDVHIWPTAETMCDRDLAAPRLNEKGDPEYDKHAPAFLLGHCCSIITDVCAPLGSRYICTADRDHRIRVSYLPRTVSLMGGSHEIQSFCFGHTAFVACVAAVGGDMIVSGGGDGTARLWRLDDGELLSTIVLAEPHDDDDETQLAALLQEEERTRERIVEEGREIFKGGAEGGAEGVEAFPGDDERIDLTKLTKAERLKLMDEGVIPRIPTRAPAVTAIACSRDGSSIVAAVEGRAQLAALTVEGASTPTPTLTLRGWTPTTICGAEPSGATPSSLCFRGEGGATELWVAAVANGEGAHDANAGVVVAMTGEGLREERAIARMTTAAPRELEAGLPGVGDAMRPRVYENKEKFEDRKKLRNDQKPEKGGKQAREVREMAAK